MHYKYSITNRLACGPCSTHFLEHLDVRLVSRLPKLFTSDFTTRLHLLSDEHDILTDAQFGVGKGVTTTVALICLYSIITDILKNKGRVC